MSEPDPAPSAPIDPAVYSVRRRGPGVAFWLLLAFGFACVVAGYLVARMGPQWFPPKPPRPAEAAAPAALSAAPSVDARLADIQARLAAGPADAAQDQIVVASAEVTALGERLDRVERRQQGTLDAAAAALAVASLDQAAQGSGSFSAELAGVERYLPASDEARRLRILADGGAPSRAALAAEFPPAAARAVAAAQGADPGRGWLARLGRAVAAVITVRRIDRTGGSGLDAVLARAEAAVNDGHLETALAELKTAPPPARDAIADWGRRAERRVAIDRSLAALRAGALQRLAGGEDLLAGRTAPSGGSLDAGL